MKLMNSMPSQVNVRTFKLNRLYNFKLPVFKILGERTSHYENEQTYKPNFVRYVETSSGDINQMSYHLKTFEITNQLVFMNYPSLERKIFQKNLTSRLLSCDFVTWVLIDTQGSLYGHL